MAPCPCPTAETYEPCHNPGVPAGGRQSPERRLYPAGTTLRFSCTASRVLLGEGSLHCLPGHPSRWSSSPPICKAGERSPLPDAPVPRAMPRSSPLTPASLSHPLQPPTMSFTATATWMVRGRLCWVAPGADGHPGAQRAWGDLWVSPALSRAAVAKAMPSGTALEGTNVAIAVFLPVLVVALLIGGVYLYFSK